MSVFVSGAGPVLYRASAMPATKRRREFPCRRRVPAAMRDMGDPLLADQSAAGSMRAIAHMKPTNSRATAVTATVLRFPRALSAR